MNWIPIHSFDGQLRLIVNLEKEDYSGRDHENWYT